MSYFYFVYYQYFFADFIDAHALNAYLWVWWAFYIPSLSFIFLCNSLDLYIRISAKKNLFPAVIFLLINSWLFACWLISTPMYLKFDILSKIKSSTIREFCACSLRDIIRYFVFCSLTLLQANIFSLIYQFFTCPSYTFFGVSYNYYVNVIFRSSDISVLYIILNPLLFSTICFIVCVLLIVNFPSINHDWYSPIISLVYVLIRLRIMYDTIL